MTRFGMGSAFGVLLLVVSTTAVSAQGVVETLWEEGAPGFEDRRDLPERAADYWVRNINNPSLTVFLPPDSLATGVGVVVCPGGGHRELVFDAEGVDVAEFLNRLGVAVFVLKYRLAREEGSPYSLDVHPRQDAYRALRMVRHRASEWGIDPGRVGIMGFSAGGEVAAMVAYVDGDGDASAHDPIDRENGRPDFQILIYPGPLGIPERIPPSAPAAFVAVAGDDSCCSTPALAIVAGYHTAGVPIEAHIYSRGGHAFNMGRRSQLLSISTWPDRLSDWLTDNVISGWIQDPK